ncbi:hypothetical protein [Deinococcus soli (ex Cha et al. 2016)]|uniref:Uncharacterized protein n=2 Tax=Deinococcus soli (ex Cha et al. 2016) TaxID=1309411 RepID=A0ACC6KD51_9DEIO|nr:hypothetical protein [Deinococcus soli (ex Cha et al. 2016)]MDR6217494.1 hypothetical protein [Deinococcus soli (ex Cha et al. 2016)]MDR6326803.1 hypothetical protein [Deinococcus soli (ex Cha et al. 2016)]MDR6750470.1 hypothetical protein [Deinococcus soli (ex Cha et al. 2016)]
MPRERPFLTEPAPGGTRGSGLVPDALFDLAVNRAAAALRGLRPARPEAALAAWHARTRFARRVPLDAVQAALYGQPQGGEWHWAGGPAGNWQPGRAPFP